jgi:hypothetical protein
MVHIDTNGLDEIKFGNLLSNINHRVNNAVLYTETFVGKEDLILNALTTKDFV